MTSIDELFEKALYRATLITYPLPIDVRLQLYAYYKQATKEPLHTTSQDEHQLVNAFKTNAWMQVSGLTSEQAKIKYVELIDELYKKIEHEKD